MIAFYKKTSCPTSQKLLAFQTGEGYFFESENIRKHLTECEFCAAEVEFYAHYPQAEEPVVKPDIPPYLFELAEALLSNKNKELKMLNKLFAESEFKTLVKI